MSEDLNQIHCGRSLDMNARANSSYADSAPDDSGLGKMANQGTHFELP
jgi:hypothetical protein